MSRTPEPLLRLTISGMHCASCVAGVEQGLRMVEGVEEARVNLVTREVFIRGRASAGEDLARRVRRAIEDMGYSVEESSELGPTGDNSPLVADPRKSWLSRMMGWLCQDGKRARAVMAGVLAIPVVAIGMAHVRGTVPDLLGLILTMGIFAVSWRPVIQPGLRCLVRRPDMNALVALGTLAAFLASAWAVGLALFGSWGAAHSGHDGGMATGSGAGLGGVYFEAAAVTLAAVLLGRWIETQCLRRAASALKDLDERIPTTAFRLAVSGAEEIVPVGELAVGDRVLIRPGDLIPTDGVVVLGQGEVDESLLTGESLPVMKKRGDAVAGGTLNGSGHFQIKVTAPAGQSAAARLAEAVRKAQMDRPRLQRMADRAAAVFVPTVMVLALATVCGWLMTGSSWSDALPYGIAVLVVACPCALGLATPAAVMAATARAAKEGVLYRDADALERLARCRLVVLDKTGTVTLGQPKLVEVVGEDGDGWLKAVAALETCSEHVWARAVVAGLAERGIVAGGGEVADFVAVPGHGVHGRVDGVQYWIGAEEWVRDQAQVSRETGDELDGLSRDSRTWITVASGGRVLGRLALEDRERPDAAEALGQLRDMGLDTLLLTGDREGPARALATRLGLKYRAGVRDKKEVIRELQLSGKVAMVGDGLNDAAALAQADCGLAMHSGTGLAHHAAHVLLMGGRLVSVPAAVALARRTVRIIRQNLGWALGYNLVGIPLAAGLLQPWLGVSLSPAYAGLFMALSSVAVTLNSLRLTVRG